MALATRVHRSTPRAMVKHPGAVAASQQRRASLTVVRRQRRAANLVMVIGLVLFLLMLASAALQTQLFHRQVTIDTLDRKIRAAHEQYDELRRERAELRSPGHLVEQAIAMGMTPALRTNFVEIDPDIIALLQRSGATEGSTGEPTVAEEFAKYAWVKAQAGGAP